MDNEAWRRSTFEELRQHTHRQFEKKFDEEKSQLHAKYEGELYFAKMQAANALNLLKAERGLRQEERAKFGRRQKNLERMLKMKKRLLSQGRIWRKQQQL